MLDDRWESAEREVASQASVHKVDALPLSHKGR